MLVILYTNSNTNIYKKIKIYSDIMPTKRGYNKLTKREQKIKIK